MCGLFGYWSSKAYPRKALATLERVAFSQTMRGRDAFGLAWRGADNTIGAFKRAGSVGDHLSELSRAVDSNCLIGHTRWTTHGSAACNDNNHPHEFDSGGSPGWVVHNGVIMEYQQIADRHGLSLRTECDSEVICRFVEETNGSLLDRMREFVTLISSDTPFAAAVLVQDGLLLARRGNPLYWSETGPRNWFASTKDALPGTIHEVPNCMAFYIPFGSGSVQQCSLPQRTMSRRMFVGSDLFS